MIYYTQAMSLNHYIKSNEIECCQRSNTLSLYRPFIKKSVSIKLLWSDHFCIYHIVLQTSPSQPCHSSLNLEFKSLNPSPSSPIRTVCTSFVYSPSVTSSIPSTTWVTIHCAISTPFLPSNSNSRVVSLIVVCGTTILSIICKYINCQL